MADLIRHIDRITGDMGGDTSPKLTLNSLKRTISSQSPYPSLEAAYNRIDHGNFASAAKLRLASRKVCQGNIIGVKP